MPNDLIQENQQLRGLISALLTSGNRLIRPHDFSSYCSCTICRGISDWDRQVYIAGLYGIRPDTFPPQLDADDDYQTLFKGLEIGTTISE